LSLRRFALSYEKSCGSGGKGQSTEAHSVDVAAADEEDLRDFEDGLV
jgi:hypothetical protein